MRLLFFGDGAWAANSLRRIAGGPSAIAAAVLRLQPSGDALAAAARDLGVPVLQPRNVNSTEFLEIVRSFAPDLNVSVSYDQIVRKPLLEAAPLGFVNIHAGMLPRYRGRNVINWALINGETEIGITAHYMDEGIDTGDILLQRGLPIGWTDAYGDVLDRVVAAIPDLLEDALGEIASGRGQRRPQDSGSGTYFGARKDGDEWLDWSDTSRNLHNKVRAISRPGPGARTRIGPRVIRIWKAFYDPSWPSYIGTPGQVVGCGAEGMRVKTGDSSLLVQEIQDGDGRPGAPSWKIGLRLGSQRAEGLDSPDHRHTPLERDIAERNGRYEPR